jgi:WS/DGAT/MGAT family acyltransferase
MSANTDRIRRRVRAEHDALRRRLVTVEGLAKRAQAEDESALAPLRKHGLALHATLSRHLDYEERELLPAVERVGRWGRELADHVRHEHDEQRVLLRYLFDELSNPKRPATLLGRDLEVFAGELREDMRLEDRDVLWELARRSAKLEEEAPGPDESRQFPHTMGFADALLWRMEGDPILRATTAALTLLERAPDRALLRATLERATYAIPRLRQRVIDAPVALATPLWREDADFDLEYHLRWLGAPGDGSLRALLDLASSLAMQAFDRDRPLWEFFVVEDLEGGRAALIQKLHHAVMDGMAGVSLMSHVYDAAPTPDDELLPEAPSRAAWLASVAAERVETAARGVRGTAGALAGFARHPLRTLSDLRGIASAISPSGEGSPLLRDRSPRYRFEVFETSVGALKAAAAAAGGRLNDGFLAALAGGWRRYHEQHGTPVETLRAGIPIARRDGGAGGVLAGNRFDLARIDVPVAERDPLLRVRAIRDAVARERERSPAWTEAFAAGLSRVPPAALRPLLSRVSRGTDFVASSVPGPDQELAVGGAPVDAFYTFGPTAGTATNVTLFSRGPRAFVTLNVDPAAVPDPARLAECMREGFDEVLKLG